MPSSTEKQARTMAAAAHDPKFAAKVGIPQKVASDFNQADKGTGIIKPKKHKPMSADKKKRVLDKAADMKKPY